MAIKVQCPNPGCGKVFSVKEEHAGRKAKCPGCASPLIIPTPEAGAFDFGVPAGGDAGNPFADLGTTTASAPPPKSKPGKKPTPPASEPADPFDFSAPAAPTLVPPELPRPAPPPAAEVFAAPVAPAPPVVVPPPTATAIPEADAQDFLANAESEGPARSSGPEPWYYGFLAGYAKVFLILGFVLVGLGVLASLVTVVGLATYAGWGTAAVYLAVTLLGAVFSLLLVVLSVAFILLIVDAARNLREIRRLIARRDS